MDLQLKGKIALVTGSSRGLGYATARLLAQEGARVVINSRSPVNVHEAERRIARETGAEVIGLPGDVTGPHIPEHLIHQAVDRMGGLDILITNSGGPPPGLFENLTPSDWRHAIELSFMSHVDLIQAALPYLKRSFSASVLTMTSFSVKQPVPNLVLSNSIRAATVALTKSLALELGREGIRFNSILPGWTDTERVRELMRNRSEGSGTSITEETAKVANETAMGRLGTPREFANAAVFLVSPAASYITGTMLDVNGGLTKGLF